MNSPRPTRNIQQVRSIIQNMGRSIDEARNRRLGPDNLSMPQPMADTRIPLPSTSAAPRTPAPASGPPTPPPSSATPPLRSAQEMFSGDTPRLKARPKRLD